ncbi:hypothetical protein B0W20_04250 [Bacillus spizizenii]|nr:hypothetical protein B0W20_04250 [Bacillus spizizenii]
MKYSIIFCNTELKEIEDDYDDVIGWIRKYIDEGAELIPERKVHIIQLKYETGPSLIVLGVLLIEVIFLHILSMFFL